jgi:hypothetical protein
MTMNAKTPLHPSLKRRVGDAAEAALLAIALIAVWGSVFLVVFGTLVFGH